MTCKQDFENREWPCWEDWQYGWQLIDERLHFEGEDITPLLPPCLVEHDEEMRTPHGPFQNPATEERDWRLHFHFKNGWEAEVSASWGVAKNAASINGFNRRVLGPQRWPANEEWDDPGLWWSTIEFDPNGADPYLEDPTHLVECLRIIAVLPSDPDIRRAEVNW